MSNEITIAISAALLLAAAAFAARAPGPRASTTNGAAIAAVCNTLPWLPHARRCAAGPHCQYFDISDRTVGPTFPTSCRQIT